MRESIEQSGVFFQLGFMRRFDSGYAAAKARVDDGAIGDPVVFKSTSRDPYPPSLSYADPRSSGGLIIDMGIHDFAGEPLMDGPGNPHDILSVLGEKALHAYLVNEIQEVDAISVLLPTVDVVFLYRDAYAPRRLFRRKPDVAVLGWDALEPALRGFRVESGPLSYRRLEYASPPTLISTLFSQAIASVPNGVVAADSILESELVAWIPEWQAFG